MVTWRRTRNRKEKRPRQRRQGCVTNIPELVETLSVTFMNEHVQESGTAGRGPTATERYTPELSAAILDAMRCNVRRSEGISIEALESGTGSHVDVTDVDASWETWETIAVGAARTDDLQFAESLDARNMQYHDLTQCDTWDEHRTEHDGSTTTKETHPNLNAASRLVGKETRRTSTILQADVAATTSTAHHLRMWSGFSVVLPC